MGEKALTQDAERLRENANAPMEREKTRRPPTGGAGGGRWDARGGEGGEREGRAGRRKGKKKKKQSKENGKEEEGFQKGTSLQRTFPLKTDFQERG